MARMTRGIGAAWVNEAILVVDGEAPSRHFWSRWMDRALAPHATEMAHRPAPIPANDVEAASDEDEATHATTENESGDGPGAAPPTLLFD